MFINSDPSSQRVLGMLPLRQNTSKPKKDSIPDGTVIPSRQLLIQKSQTAEVTNSIIAGKQGAIPKYVFPDPMKPPTPAQAQGAYRRRAVSGPQQQVDAAKAAVEYDKLAAIPEGKRSFKDKQVMKSLLVIINNASFLTPGSFETLKNDILKRESAAGRM